MDRGLRAESDPQLERAHPPDGPAKPPERPGLTLYRVRKLPAEDRAEVDGLRVTNVHRTLLDLAATAQRTQLDRALEQAVRMQVFDLNAATDLLDRSRGRAGVRALRAALAEHQPEAVRTREELERRFFDFCRSRAFPLPVTNVSVAGFVVDAFWPVQGLVVELDSWAHHGGRGGFEDDHARTAALQLARYDVVRVTWRMLHDDPGTVTALLQAHFGRPAAAPAQS